MPRIVLIPVIQGNEDNGKFLLKATAGSDLAVIANIMDNTDGQTLAGEMASQMMEREALIEEMEKKLHARGTRVKVYSEWGKFTDKVKAIFEREGASEIAVIDLGKKSTKAVSDLKKVGKVNAIKLT